MSTSNGISSTTDSSMIMFAVTVFLAFWQTSCQTASTPIVVVVTSTPVTEPSATPEPTAAPGSAGDAFIAHFVSKGFEYRGISDDYAKHQDGALLGVGIDDELDSYFFGGSTDIWFWEDGTINEHMFEAAELALPNGLDDVISFIKKEEEYFLNHQSEPKHQAQQTIDDNTVRLVIGFDQPNQIIVIRVYVER